VNNFRRKELIRSAIGFLRVAGFSRWKDHRFSKPVAMVSHFGRASVDAMNTMTPLQPANLPGFKVVPKRHLGEFFSPSQNAYYILIGRRGTPDAPRESVLFVYNLDHFLDECQRQIDKLWEKHRVLITHVAVKLCNGLRPAHGDLAELYERAITVQQLRQKLHPRFRRV